MNLGGLWDDICNLIIRPQRNIYDPSTALGPRLFTLGLVFFFELILKKKRKQNL